VIEAQRDMLRTQATPAVSQGSGLDDFLSGLDVGGFITGSYIYNFNSPSSNAGAQPLCQFNCNHDEFSFDAAMISIGKEASNPGDAGFQLDLLFGQNGDISRALSPTAGGAGTFGDSDFDVFVQEAYITYNWSGVELKFGNWETLLGWEVLDSHLNYNISHGILFTWAIPLYHTGFVASGSLGETGIGWSLGITNGFNNVVDTNDNKGIVGIVSYEEGPFFTSLSWFWGSEEPNLGISAGSTDDLMIFDFIASLDLDSTFLWLNVDYGEHEDAILAPLFRTSDSDYWGVAVGANFTITEKASFALRGEWWNDDDDVRGAAGIGPFDGADVEMYSLTGTLAYELTEHLTVRGELRYDKADDDTILDGKIFPDGGTADDDSLSGIIEVSYVF
jgi:hypothetical protein